MIKLNYKSFGQGEPILILHGLFGMLDNWQQFAKELAEDHSVFILDQRNHGKSPHTDAMSYHLMSRDLLHFMEDEAIFRATIIGHSMGGKTAMQFALEYPDHVAKLIVIDISPKKNEIHHTKVFEALQAVPIDKVESRADVEKILSEYIDDAGIRLFLQKNLQRKKSGGYKWKMNLPVIVKHYEDILDEVLIDEVYEGPTLFVKGGKSNYILEGDLQIIKERFPNAKLITMPEAGHWVHVEAFEDLLSEIREFLMS